MKTRPAMITVLKDLFVIQVKPQIFFLTVAYVLFLVCWVIGIVSTWLLLVLPPPYLLSPTQFALSYLAPMIGDFVGEVWGHYFNDFVANWYIRTHNGFWVSEVRLWGTYMPTLVGFAGLVLIGQTLQQGLHWISLCVGWGFLVFAMVSATTAVSAYCLDSFPNHAALVAAIINMWRTTAGFCVVFFQLKWIAADGPATSFGIQALLLALAFLAGPVLTQIMGKKWRHKYAPPKAEN
ncbi:hypothetical protein LTR86_010376 [Recurvomyces mirabilis]|nr:hypothetical protein LTR86_010376 [Recurvomyces mirabilis]